jgi:hypothetical protein
VTRTPEDVPRSSATRSVPASPSFPSVIVRTAVLASWAVLAIPLTQSVHSVLVGQDPDRQWARSLLAGTSGATATRGRAAARPVPLSA